MVSSVVEGVGFSVVEGVMFFVLEGVVFDTDGFLCRIFCIPGQQCLCQAMHPMYVTSCELLALLCSSMYVHACMFISV